MDRRPFFGSSMPDEFVTFSASAAYAIHPTGDQILSIKRPPDGRQTLTFIANFGEQVRRWPGDERQRGRMHPGTVGLDPFDWIWHRCTRWQDTLISLGIAASDSREST